MKGIKVFLIGFLIFITSYRFTDGIDTLVIQCGEDPDGVFDCIFSDYDDGSDCVILCIEDDCWFYGC